jgi:zinc/manganese transport system ATP-binding protein
VIRVEDLVVRYGSATALDDVSLTVGAGERVALIGPNGAGKSTLLDLVAGVHRPHTGVIDHGGARRDIAYSVQRSEVTDTFPVTVAQAVMMGRWSRLGLWRRPGREDRQLVAHWMCELGLEPLASRRLGELSGGQRQRVLLAQAFSQQASVLLLDEPTTGLDTATTAQVIGHLGLLAHSGVTVIAATHDPAVIAAADHQLSL